MFTLNLNLSLYSNGSKRFPNFILGLVRTRMGAPSLWSATHEWLQPHLRIHFPQPPAVQVFQKKLPQVPDLLSYKLPPPRSFWSNFPSLPIPKVPRTPIIVQNLIDLVTSVKHHFTSSQEQRAATLIQELTQGAIIPLSKPLPAIVVPNTPSVYEHGVQVTDTIGTWINDQFVAGPFSTPPYNSFRSNSMIALEQKNKIRLVMNLTGPKGASFNDAVPEQALERVHMSTAKTFGYAIIDCGTKSLMSKFDMANAYKNIPTATQDLPLHGFMWLGSFFLETQLPFGSKVAVASFDRLGHTMEVITSYQTKFPASLRHRTLDDLPIVVPAGSPLGVQFCSNYKDNCQKIGLKLAPNCPNFAKAFENSTVGTVLGVQFNTELLTWSLDTKKCDAIQLRIKILMNASPVTLLEIQQLYGSLTDFSNMCPFLKAFRLPLQILLTSCSDNGSILPTTQVVTDLKVWWAGVQSARSGLPIPARPVNPHMAKVCFVSDAAGARFQKRNNRFIPYGASQENGAAAINQVDGYENIWFCAVLTWPDFFLYSARDSKDHAYGCKTTTLEVIAMILPFLCIPHQLRGTHVLLLTDNLPLVYGWESRHVVHDVSASIFIRAIHMISFYLGTQVDVLHLPRNSTHSARLADALTRKSTTTTAVLHHVKGCRSEVPAVLTSWLNSPTEDWMLANQLLKLVIDICPSDG